MLLLKSVHTYGYSIQKHVQDALARMAGVTGVDVSLEKKTATVQEDRDIPMDEFAKVIADAGYELVK